MNLSHFNKQMLLLLFLPFLLSYTSSAQQNRKKLANYIYEPYKQFLFEAKYDSAERKTHIYILMKVTDEFRDGGTGIEYLYFCEIPDTNKIRVDFAYNDTLKKCYNWNELTQAEANPKYIWLHPPRSHFHGLAAYYPFPEINIPIKIGKKYKRSDIIFHEPRLHGKMLCFSHKIKIGDLEKYRYKDLQIDVYRTSGQAESKLGKHSFYYLFNDQLGFVHWYYNLNDVETLELSLIGVY
ncbi:MAG: hypothetical protein LBG17_02735 [Bacteroidales bacterium]|nr:hypothetical protein [Bacteroidales bacterium]